MEIILETFKYIQRGPYFWGSMGFIVASAMLIGTMVFGSDYKQTYKFLLGLATYIIMLTFVNFSRAYQSILPDLSITSVAKAYASTLTTIIVTFFWVLGLLLGLAIDKYKKVKYDRA